LETGHLEDRDMGRNIKTDFSKTDNEDERWIKLAQDLFNGEITY